MALTKTKIRLSSFVLLIIDNDCQAFGFISKDNSPNRNGFLNKVIPNLVDLRKKRREEIEKTLKDDFQEKTVRQYMKPSTTSSTRSTSRMRRPLS